MDSSASCPRCGFAFEPHEITYTDGEGVTHTDRTLTTPGAFSVTTATLLSLMQREWERPVPESAGHAFVEATPGMAPRFICQPPGPSLMM
jgi:hypothetical protein